MVSPRGYFLKGNLFRIVLWHIVLVNLLTLQLIHIPPNRNGGESAGANFKVGGGGVRGFALTTRVIVVCGGEGEEAAEVG